jgi:hypothetical protein
MNTTNERFSFREMEQVAVQFAISCVKGYKGSFEDYMLTIPKDWRINLKRVSNQETNIEDYHRMTTTPHFLCRDLKISKSNSRDSDCNCGQPSCSLCG